MKHSFITVFLLTALVVNVATVIGSTRAQTCIGGGALQITSVPAVEALGSGAVGTTESTVTHDYGTSIFFEDMRGTVPGGFTLSVTATDMKKGSDTLDVTKLGIASDNDDSVGAVDCDGTSGISVSLTTISGFTDGDNNGTSDSKTLFVGDNRARVGKYSFEPSIGITVPAYQPQGTYRTTLVFSII